MWAYVGIGCDEKLLRRATHSHGVCVRTGREVLGAARKRGTDVSEFIRTGEPIDVMARREDWKGSLKGNKYQELDDAICEHVLLGRGHPTSGSVLKAIARQWLIDNKKPFLIEWRLIDRRMQAMRKSGRLVYERTKGGRYGKWRIAYLTDAPIKETVDIDKR